MSITVKFLLLLLLLLLPVRITISITTPVTRTCSEPLAWEGLADAARELLAMMEVEAGLDLKRRAPQVEPTRAKVCL